jgi:hypothetical protein
VDAGLAAVYVCVPGVVRMAPFQGPQYRPVHNQTMRSSERTGGRPGRTRLSALPAVSPNEIAITGRLDLDRNGRLAGDLTLHAYDVFFDRKVVGDAAAQKRFADDMLRRLLPGLEAESVAVSVLDAGFDKVQLDVRAVTKHPLPVHQGVRVLRFGPEPLFRKSLDLHLDHADRETELGGLRGGIYEGVELEIRLPPGWKVLARPREVLRPWADKFSLRQVVTVEPGKIRFVRDLRLEAKTIPPALFPIVRDAINQLRAEGGRTFLFAEK